MNGIYYIENYIDEIHSAIQGYFATEEEAREGLKSCANWFRPNGTGRIYFQKFGLHGERTLVYENQ